MLRPKPSMSLNPAAASFPFSKSSTDTASQSSPLKSSINTSPTSTQSSWTGNKTSSTTSIGMTNSTSTESKTSTASSNTHPRTSSVSSVTTTSSSSDKKVKSFGEDWLSSPYDFSYEPRPAPSFLEAGPIGRGRPVTVKQEYQDEDLIIFNDQPHLPPPPPICRARSPSLPIHPSEQSTPKVSLPLAPAPYIPRYTIDAASRKLLNSCLEGQAPGHRAPHAPATNAPWIDETHSFRDLPSLDSLADQLANISIGQQRAQAPSFDSLADQLAGIAISSRHDTRSFNPVVGQDHHLMHHASTPNFVRNHRRSDARVRFDTIKHEEHEDEGLLVEDVKVSDGQHLQRKSTSGVIGASTGKNIYIHSVPPDLTPEQLEHYASRFGNVSQTRCKAVGEVSHGAFAPPIRYCGFVLFFEREDADRFLKHLQSKSVTCDYGRDDFQLEHKALEDRESSNLYINGLPSDTTERHLIALLEPYGTIASFKLLTDRGERRGPIMVRMNTRAQADAVIRALNNVPLQSGKILQVRIADSLRQKQFKASANLIHGPPLGGADHSRRQRQSMPPPAREHVLSAEELHRRQQALAELAELDSIAAKRTRQTPGSFPAYKPPRPQHHRGTTFPNSSASHPVMFPDQAKHRHISSNFSNYENVTTPTGNLWTSRNHSHGPYPMAPALATSWSSRGLNSDTSPLWSPPTPSSATFSPSPPIWADQSWHTSSVQHSQEVALFRDERDIWTRRDDPQNQRSMQSMHAKSSPELQRAMTRIPSSLWSELDGAHDVKQEH